MHQQRDNNIPLEHAQRGAGGGDDVDGREGRHCDGWACSRATGACERSAEWERRGGRAGGLKKIMGTRGVSGAGAWACVSTKRRRSATTPRPIISHRGGAHQPQRHAPSRQARARPSQASSSRKSSVAAKAHSCWASTTPLPSPPHRLSALSPTMDDLYDEYATAVLRRFARPALTMTQVWQLHRRGRV